MLNTPDNERRGKVNVNRGVKGNCMGQVAKQAAEEKFALTYSQQQERGGGSPQEHGYRGGRIF